jgi:hypothetical protein
MQFMLGNSWPVLLIQPLALRGAEYDLRLLSAETGPKEVVMDTVMVTRGNAEFVEHFFL